MERSIVHVGPGGRAAAAHATSSVPSRAALFLRTGGSFPPRAGRGIPRAHADRSVKLSARTAGEGVGEASAGESVPRAPSYSAVATGVAAEGRERKLHPVQAHGPGSALVTFDCDVLEGRFVLEADEVEEICEECELTPIQLMRSLIGQAQKVRPPPFPHPRPGAPSCLSPTAKKGRAPRTAHGRARTGQGPSRRWPFSEFYVGMGIGAHLLNPKRRWLSLPSRISMWARWAWGSQGASISG
mmetsp:Transcript_45841/g.146235  ORF Transcript_45841/g.146235 Transcript_45841/m.146235 type:complete len:242 (-) Transcript_45841:1097-1822(-)